MGNAIVPATAAHAVSTLSRAALEQRTGFIQSPNGHFMKYPYPIKMNIPPEKYIPNSYFTLGQTLFKDRLSTPLALAFSVTKVGSERASRILQNEIMYDTNTLAHKNDKNPDHYIINPRFIEWMMGYPTDWTKIKNRI